MATVGATPAGGVTRTTLSDADREARGLFVQWCREAGLAVRWDDMGNLYARRPGQDPDAAPVMIGSHLDSIPRGGRFDGALGVLAALEVVRTLNDHGAATRRPIEVVNWTNEEGARFPPATLGSGVIAGAFGTLFAHDRRDWDGKRFGDELARIGYLGDPANRPGAVDTYLELHIEQGPVLEADGLEIGVVTGIVGTYWAQITLEGQAQHAGPTPMAYRRDPLVAAGRAAALVRDTAVAVPGGGTATVGRLHTEWPNIINAIPGKVSMTLDVRHPTRAGLDEVVGRIRSGLAAICAEERVSHTWEEVWNMEPPAFAPDAVEAVETAARELGLTHRRIIAGAAHDAKYMNELCRTAMVFVPSLDGKSHCEEEFTHWNDCTNGADVLRHAALYFANR